MRQEQKNTHHMIWLTINSMRTWHFTSCFARPRNRIGAGGVACAADVFLTPAEEFSQSFFFTTFQRYQNNNILKNSKWLINRNSEFIYKIFEMLWFFLITLTFNFYFYRLRKIKNKTNVTKHENSNGIFIV
jgi:hypothetical protein